MNKGSDAGLREALERFRYCMDPGFPKNGSILVPTKDLRALIRALTKVVEGE